MKNATKKKRNPGKKKAAKMDLAAFIAIVFNVNTGAKTGKPGMTKVYWAPSSAITAQPEPTTTYGAAGATAATTGSWSFATEAGFTTNGFIDLKNDLLKGSKITYTQEGDMASPSDSTKLTLRVIGWDAELVERFRDVAGTPGVLMVKTPDCAGTEYWVIGCGCAPAFMKPTGDTDEMGGTAGKRWDIEVTAHCSPYKWSGTITLKAV